jgi:hypothetical protein
VLPKTISSPSAKVVIDRTPGWEMLWKVTPLATSSENVENRVEDDTPTPLGSRGLVSDWQVEDYDIPLALSKLVWVGFHRKCSLPL